MKAIPIYRYKRADGGVTDTPVKPEGVDYTERIRLIAEDGKMLTFDNEELCPVVDVDTIDGWIEVDAPESTEEGCDEILTPIE